MGILKGAKADSLLDPPQYAAEATAHRAQVTIRPYGRTEVNVSRQNLRVSAATKCLPAGGESSAVVGVTAALGGTIALVITQWLGGVDGNVTSSKARIDLLV